MQIAPVREADGSAVASVLVVDDRAADRALISTLLSYAGHDVLEAIDGQEALDVARSRQPDLIISDILMPGMNGYEFARRLREDPDIAEIPLMFLTASYAREEIEELIEACGVSAVVEKPASPDEIMHAIGDTLGSEQTLRPLASDKIDREELRVLNDKLVEKLNELEEADAENTRLLAHLMHAQEAERARIASDIHDDPLQTILAAGLQLDALEHRLDGSADAEAVRAVRRSIEEAATHLRNMLFEIRPRELDTHGLEAVLRSDVKQWAAAEDFSFEIESELARDIPSEVRTLLYRAAQEALINARKHARAQTIRVLIGERDHGVFIRVSDDGIGFEPREVKVRPDHFGLPALRRRLEHARGSLRIESAPESGTTLEMWAPTP
jgi:signal transduction histidine kinase